MHIEGLCCSDVVCEASLTLSFSPPFSPCFFLSSCWTPNSLLVSIMEPFINIWGVWIVGCWQWKQSKRQVEYTFLSWIFHTICFFTSRPYSLLMLFTSATLNLLLWLWWMCKRSVSVQILYNVSCYFNRFTHIIYLHSSMLMLTYNDMALYK